jgi:energy-coupling factor transporter ATP-binding protein EcfA2
MHVVLKYNDSLYSVDTIEEHLDVIKKKGKVIWGIIKPNENSPGIGKDKIKTINDQIQNGIETKAFFYNQGHIKGIGLISRFWDRDEMRNGQYLEFIPEYYRSDINKCVGGIELREIIKRDDDSFERENLYQHDRTERINFGNQVNPMYVFEKKPRLYFAKKEYNQIKNIEVKDNMEDSNITVTDEITNIKNYIRSRGFLYDDNLIENYYLSLKTKPFLILAGISGTGKSKLARLFAEAIDATAENRRFKLVPVRPDWSDSTDLLGYKDLNGRFHPGVLTTFVKDAMKNPQYPYFFVLDEMNLARVEYYFSDVLSIIESRNKVNKTIVTDRLLNRELLDSVSYNEYGDIYIPENLYFIGTVNMDETTFPFSKKVLDRANVIELSDVDLDYAFDDVEEVLPKTLNNDFLRSDFLTLKDCAGYDDIVDETISILKNINEVLGYYRFGYRVRDEICFYIIYNSIYGLMDFDDAMDYEILQKILPRINGSSISIKKILIELFKICSGNLENRFDYDSDVSEKMFEEIANVKYRKSCDKIAFMTRRYEEDGFTSYWL